MITVNSPLPLAKNYRPFTAMVGKLLENRPASKVLYNTWLAFRKAAYLEAAEKLLYKLRAREKERGGAERAYRLFEAELAGAASFDSLKKSFHRFQDYCRAAPRVEAAAFPGPPDRRNLCCFRKLVNHDLARALGSLNGSDRGGNGDHRFKLAQV